MKWFDCKFRSVADTPCGKYTLGVLNESSNLIGWSVSIDSISERDVLRLDGTFAPDENDEGDEWPTREAAKSAAEKWYDQQDKPVWQTSELAACATWRGWGMVVRPNLVKPGFVSYAATPYPGFSSQFIEAATLAEAMTAIEAEVRKATQ